MKILKVIIFQVLIINSLSLNIISKRINIGDSNICNNNQESGGHFRKHVSECYNLNGNISGGVTGLNNRNLPYSGQTLIMKSILDQIGSWLHSTETIAITKVGSKILELHYNNSKLSHINSVQNQQNSDFKFRIFTGNNYQTPIKCLSNDDYKTINAINNLIKNCAFKWTSLRENNQLVEIKERTSFKKNCINGKLMKEFINEITTKVNQALQNQNDRNLFKKCYFISCYEKRNGLVINDKESRDLIRKELNSHKAYFSNTYNKC